MFKRILVPLDGSERAECALPVAARVARAASCALLLLRVVHPSGLLIPSAAPVAVASTAEHDRANAYLRKMAHCPDIAGIPSECQLWEGEPASAILGEASRRQMDLIVLASHGQGGLLRWALGSVAQRVARDATMPVLVVRSDGMFPAGPHPGAERPLRILVGLDGSSLAEAALGPASELIMALAAPTVGAVHLVGVERRYTVEEQAEQHPELAPTALPAVEEAKAYLRGITAQLQQFQHVPV
jgi:nucleotide-binding universal stress UspA family protein